MAQLKDLLVTGPSRFIGDVFAENLQAFRITDDLVPIENNTYSLGTTSLKWKEIHAVSFKGEADKAKQLSDSHTFKVSDSDKTNTGSTSLFNGTQDIELLLPSNIKFSNILATSNITVNTGDIDIVNVQETNKFLGFYYNANKTAGASWRIGHIGSGSGDTNYFVIQSGTSATSATAWNDVLRLEMNSFNALFKANVNPQVTDTQSLGTSSLKWNSIYATHLYGEADKAIQLSNSREFKIQDNYAAYTGSTVVFNGTGDVTLKLNKDTKFDNIRVVTTVRPETTNTGTLGTGSYFWKGAYISGRDNGYGIHWNNLMNKNSSTGNPILTTEYTAGLPRIFGYGTTIRPSNLFYGVKASSTVVELTTNGGSTWTEKSLNVENLFTGATITATPGLNTAGTGFDAYDAESTSSTTGGGSGKTYAANYWKNKGIRITFNTAPEYRYGWVDCIVLHFGTANTTGGETISSTSNSSHYIIERQQYDGTWTTIAQSNSTNWNSNDRTQIIYPQPSFYLQATSTTNNASYAKAIRITFIVDSWGTAYRYAPRLISCVGYGTAGGLNSGASFTGSEFARFMTSYDAPYLIEDYRTGTLGFDSDLLPRKRITEGAAIVTNNVHNIGGTSRRWAGIYAQNGNFAGNMDITGNTTISGTTRINNILTLYRSGTIAQNLPSGIEFANKDSDGQDATKGYIYYYNDHDAYNYGGHMMLGAYSSLFLGGGEGPLAVGQKLTATTTTSAEHTYILADSNIYLEANTQNDATATTNNRIGFQIDTSGNLVPVKAETANNNAQNIGTSSNKLANIYATNFYGNITGDVTGNAASASQIYTAVTVPPIGYIEFQSNQTTGTGNASLRHHNSLRVDSNVSTTATTLAQTNLIIGNSTQEGTKENSRGVLTLYGPKTYETKIFSAVSTAANNLYIPGYTGDGYVVTTDSTSAQGSNTNPVYVAANGRITKLTYTANRLYYSASTSSFEATSHYASSTKVGINTTSEPSYNLYVSGTFYTSGNSAIGGTLGVTGATTLSSTLAVTSTSTFTGKATFNGGVLVSGLTASQAVLTDANKNLISRAISDSSSAEALGTSSNLVTERDVYNGLPKLNNAHTYTSSSDYYAPTGGGTAGQMLFATGATSAPAWDTPRIEGVQIKKGATFYYGYCETAAGTAAKTVALTGTQIFTLETGARVIVKFKETNTASNPTLNVNSKGAKNIYRYGTTAAGTTAVTSWTAGAVVEFVYDGTGWLMTGYSTGRIEPGTSGYILVGNGTTSDPTWQDILGVAHGGTGLNTLTTNRIYYPSAATTLSASSHYISSTKIGVNTTSEPSYNLYVSGTFYTSGNSAIGGTLGVTGATTLSSTLGVTGKATFSGGIGTTLDASKVVMTDANKDLTTRALSDSSSAEALSTNTNIVTERDVYYGLPTINNAHNYTSSTTIYAPTGGGDSGALLFANGATSTPTWAKARIEGVQIKGGETPATLHYGYCETVAGTAAKTVALTGTQTFTLETGARVIVKFQNSNTASNATLKVNNSEAKPIYKYGTTYVGTREATSWKAGSVVEFVYDGVGWLMASSSGGALDLQSNQAKKAYLIGYNSDDEVYYYDTDNYLTTTAGLLYSKYLKAKYLRVNSDDTGTSKDAIISGNIDIGTGEPIFTGTGSEVFVTSNNLGTWFTKTDESYYFTVPTADSEYWTSNNNSTNNTYARTELTATQNCIATFIINLNGYQNDTFTLYLNGTSKYTKNYINSTTFSITQILNLKIGDKVKLEFYHNNTSSSYTHQAKVQIKTQAATVSETLTTMKDVTSFTRTDESTSTTTGAVKISGGLGVAKNINGGGKITVAGDANFTSGTLITQNIVVGDGNDVVLNNSNLSTYFTVANDVTYPWIAPSASYTANVYTPSGSYFDITSSNVGSYFTVTNPSNSGVAWTWNSTEGAYGAGSTTTNQKYYIDFTATAPGLLKFTYKKHAYSSDQFYIYHIPSGTTTQNQIFGDTSSRTYTTYYACNNNGWRVETGDKIRFYFNRQTSTSTSYNHTVFVKISYQILTATTNQTNGAYWMNGNFEDSAINKTSSLKLTAKQNCLLSLDGTGSNTNGDTFTVLRNNTSIGTSTTITGIQVFNGDVIELRYARGSQTYNNAPSNTHQAHIVLKYQAGSTAKEVVLSGRTRITNNTAATSTTTGALQVTGGIGVQGAGYFGSLNTTGALTATGNITGDWLKGSHLRINSDDTTDSKKAIINGNTDIIGDINLGTGDPIYTANGTEATLNNDNIETYFTKTDGGQYFRPPNSEWYTYEVVGSGAQTVLTNSNITSYFTSVTPSVSYGSTSYDSTYPWTYDSTNQWWSPTGTQDHHALQTRIAWKATTASYITFDWSVYSESLSYDYLGIFVNGVEKIRKGSNPATSGTISLGLAENDVLEFIVRKDGSGNPAGEYYRIKMTRYANSQTNTITHPVGNYWESSNRSATNTTAEMTLVAKQNCIFTVQGTLNHTGSTFNILLNGTNVYTNTTAGTNVTFNKSIDVPQNATVKLQFLRGNQTNTSYTYVAQLVLKTVNANVYNSVTTFKDVVRGLRTDQSTSTSTGAITTAGGLGVAKNTYIGGNVNIGGTLVNSGNTSFTGGVFLTQNIVTGSGSDIIVNNSNMATYFTMTNDNIYPWIAPDASYTAISWAGSGSETNITSSNASTYFTVTNPSNSGTAWTWNSTENAYQAGRSDAVTTYYYIDFKAKQNCLIKFQYKKHAYSNDQFYIYYIPNGGSQVTLTQDTNAQTQTAYTNIGSTYRLNTNDTIRLYFRRYTNTSTSYEHMVYVKPIYQAIVGSTTLTNGTYWMNGNFEDSAINKTATLKLVAKNNCLLSLDGTGSNTSGDTFTVLRNGTSVGTSTTLNNIQVFQNDTIEIKYARGSQLYNNAPSNTHQAHIVLKWKSGSVGKEAVINNNLRMPNLAAANGVVFTDGSKNLISKEVRINGMRITSGIITGYGTCTTATGEVAKVVTLQNSEGFTLDVGARVFVKFSTANTVINPTLNVNNTGAKPIQDYAGTAPNLYKSWRAGETVEFIYDGTAWLRIGSSTDPFWRIPYGTCSVSANTAAKTVAITNFVLETGAHIFVKFQYNNTVASPTLNVNGTGAKTIYRYGTTAPGTVSELSWQPNAVVEFIYDGNYWQMVNGNGGGVAPGESGYILTGAGTSAAPTWTNILPITHGGTGLSTFTTNRIYYASAATTLSASSHYIANDKIAVNSTTAPSYTLYVNGTLYATTLILPTSSSTTTGAIWIG